MILVQAYIQWESREVQKHLDVVRFRFNFIYNSIALKINNKWTIETLSRAGGTTHHKCLTQDKRSKVLQAVWLVSCLAIMTAQGSGLISSLANRQ